MPTRRKKPCDVPCPKCGSTQASRKYREKGTTFMYYNMLGTGAQYANPYARPSVVQETGILAVLESHVEHSCKTCGYTHQTRPLDVDVVDYTDGEDED